MGLQFLKAVNRGDNPKVGKHVIVIGCGNAGMDTARGAYDMGAETVTCIDVQNQQLLMKKLNILKAVAVN